MQARRFQEGIILFLDMLNIDKISKLFHHRYNVSTICHTCQSIVSDLKDINYYFLIHRSDLNDMTVEQYIYRHQTTINDYNCEKCGVNGQCTRNNQLGYIPPIVIIVFEKYTKKHIMNFPAKFEVTSVGDPLNYKVVAQIEHAGHAGGGHYWTVAKRKTGCYRLNDTHQSESKLSPTSMTYMVFYHRY